MRRRKLISSYKNLIFKLIGTKKKKKKKKKKKLFPLLYFVKRVILKNVISLRYFIKQPFCYLTSSCASLGYQPDLDDVKY